MSDNDAELTGDDLAAGLRLFDGTDAWRLTADLIEPTRIRNPEALLGALEARGWLETESASNVWVDSDEAPEVFPRSRLTPDGIERWAMVQD